MKRTSLPASILAVALLLCSCATSSFTAAQYFERANREKAMGDCHGAIADYGHAIALQPDFAEAFTNRAGARLSLGDCDGAIADYDRSFALKPGRPKSIRSRAVAKQIKGDFDGAIADYDRSIALAPDDSQFTRVYRALLLARLHRGEPIAELARVNEGMPAGWSQTVIRFLNGDLTEKELFATVDAGDDARKRERRCEAAFNAGMAHLLKNEPGPAREFLQQCLDVNIPDFLETMLAREELKHLPAVPAAARNKASDTEFTDLKTLDQAPRITFQEPPVYPPECKQRRLQGQVEIACVVDRSGIPQEVKCIKGNHPAFAVAAIEAVRKWRFTPGMKNGRPVMTRMLIPIGFNIE